MPQAAIFLFPILSSEPLLNKHTEAWKLGDFARGVSMLDLQAATQCYVKDAAQLNQKSDQTRFDLLH